MKASTHRSRRLQRLGLGRVKAALGVLALGLGVGAMPSTTSASTAHVLLVGTWKGVPGQFATIQAAVNAAQPGDWILVAPGDYHENGAVTPEPAGVLITTSRLHLRGMDRNQVVVDGTRPGAPQCSGLVGDQVLGRDGIVAYKANGVYIENLTVCNFLTDTAGKQGNQIWWNGGDGQGHIGLHGYWGSHLTATSTYSNGVSYPAGSYGIFSSDASGGSFADSYASNMSDSAFYIGACQQVCNVVMNHDHGQYSALCLSSTNAGGYLLVENTECDQNKTGLVSNSQNNDDWPAPQNGLCPPGVRGPLGTPSCTVWMNNFIHDNNNPNVPGNGTSGLAGAGPVGTGLILGGSRGVTLYHNTVVNNGAWGELIADLPDQEMAPAGAPNCSGGIWVPGLGICYFQAYGNVSLDNQFANNGSFGNPGNGDIALATIAHNPGNCYARDSDPAGVTTDPPGMESSSAYRPVKRMCTSANSGDMAVAGSEAICATQLLAPCPALNTLCLYNPNLPCIPAPGPLNYPRATQVVLSMPPAQPGMSNPCTGVPPNPWCP